ncbi:MAG: GGDEF domain-containing protein [Spirochaetia bacterium]|nr:GGDEF domain-containing protein [Spirochaetia bacterium]
MNKFKNEIHPFLVVLRDQGKEKKFLEWSFPDHFNFFKIMVYVGIFATIAFIIPDFLKSGLNKSLIISSISRTIFSIAVYLMFVVIKRVNKPVVFHRLLFILSNLITINITIVIITMKNHSIIYSLSEIISIIVIYVLLKQRFLYSLLSAIPASIVIIVSHIIYGDLDVPSLQTIIFAFILANLIGIIYNRNINISSRKEYLSLILEQKLNARLEKEIEQREKFQNDLLEIARTDHLTSLYNRRFFMDLAAQEIFKSERYGIPMSLLTIDIDHFKAVNDQYGHPEGDVILIEFSKKLKSMIRKSDVLARIGGEEFILLAPNTEMHGADILAENLRHLIEHSSFGTKDNIKITISVGVAQFNNGDTLADLMRNSDKALYLAKNNGRNQVIFFN